MKINKTWDESEEQYNGPNRLHNFVHKTRNVIYKRPGRKAHSEIYTMLINLCRFQQIHEATTLIHILYRTWHKYIYFYTYIYILCIYIYKQTLYGLLQILLKHLIKLHSYNSGRYFCFANFYSLGTGNEVSSQVQNQQIAKCANIQNSGCKLSQVSLPDVVNFSLDDGQLPPSSA